MSDEKRQILPEAKDAYLRQRSTEFEAHPQAERLVDWFKANAGWLSPDVEIAYSNSRGFHLRAIRPLSSSVLVRCPLRLTLSHLNLDNTQTAVLHVDSPLKAFVGVLPNHVLTRLLLIEQRYLAKTGEGPWQPYIACLPEPEAMTSSVWFDDDDMDCLVGTNLAAATRSTLALLTEEWEHAVEVLRDAKLPTPDFLELKSFEWAASILSSRSFSSDRILPDREPFPILFPVVDILNHSTNANIEWDARPFEDFALKQTKHEAVQPGDEIFNNYFPKQNGEWLLAYGFCFPDNPVEQFAIKMTIPLPMEEALRKVGLYKPENVPFGMSKAFLASNPNQEQQYLRTRGHPFERYENSVCFLRGIPPWIVHLHFIMVLQNLGIEPASVDKAHPPARIVFDILLKLYEALEMKSRLLPILDSPRTFPNIKQKYAYIYRNGQARIIHAVREELRAVFDKLQVQNQMSPSRPVIISTTEALIALKSDFPEHYQRFENGLKIYYDTTILTWSSYSAQISALEEADHPAELSVWKVLLFALAHLYTTTFEKRDKLVHRWIQALQQLHPLPTVAAVDDEEPVFDDDMLGDFVHGVKRPIRDLNHTVVQEELPLELGEPTGERLGDRVAAWADGVVERCAFQLDGSERMLMYLETGDEAVDGEWAYREEEIELGQGCGVVLEKEGE
ncbi:SET domain-containing protein [Lentithecium fluviatile CBS 122367]|uniref:SET domain-containing protein n=1 Tax=Lentithecium fluviatile CBS 122367 TaxID=1168545 RepID=A0A6G1JI21_9PLEO|nr:SET domain-containing protein [Lentithecium fluviatile CBS 122367]